MYAFNGGTAGGSLFVGPVGTVEGTITDPAEAAIPRVTITARNAQTGLSQSTTTDDAGRYRLSLPAGNYEISANASGFNPYRTTSYVGVGRKTGLNATLNVGSVSETVEVEAVAEKLSP